MNIAQIEVLLAREGLSPADMDSFCSTEARVVFTDEMTGDETNLVDTVVDECEPLEDALDRERVLAQWGHLLSQYEEEDPAEEVESAEPSGFGFLARGGV